MVFYVIVIVAAIALAIWFVRSPLFRAHLRRHETPGEVGQRVGGIQYNDWQDPKPRD
jgi:hypothetical protein